LGSVSRFQCITNQQGTDKGKTFRNLDIREEDSKSLIIQQALLSVELQGSATWNFGPVSWHNVTIVAETTETAVSHPVNLDVEAITNHLHVSGALALQSKLCPQDGGIFSGPNQLLQVKVAARLATSSVLTSMALKHLTPWR
jgi:hypothetical protein